MEKGAEFASLGLTALPEKTETPFDNSARKTFSYTPAGKDEGGEILGNAPYPP